MALVGARLRELRKARKLTQDQLADRTGIARTDISGFENDRISIGPDRLATIAEALEVSVLELQPAAEVDPLGLTLQDRQAELEAEVLRLAGQVTRLTRRVRTLERRLPPGSTAAWSGAAK